MLIGLKEKSLEMNSPLLKTITDIVLQCLCFQQDLLTLCCSFQNKEIEQEKLHSGIFLEIVNCINCTFIIAKKINKIMILNCENCNIFCEELISDIEIINCTKIRTTCKGCVNLAIVYRSKDIFFFLNAISRKLRIRRSFSSHIMLKINKDQNEDFKEYEDILLPEQFVFQINKDKKLDIKYIGF